METCTRGLRLRADELCSALGITVPMRLSHCCQERSALERRFVVGGYRIVRCERCGLQYVDPLPPLREIEALYYGEAFDLV